MLIEKVWWTFLYSPPRVRPPLAPEDEELLRDDEAATPIKKDGIKRKERPTDKGVAWLVKTQYISPLSMESTKQVLGVYTDMMMHYSHYKQKLTNILFVVFNWETS